MNMYQVICSVCVVSVMSVNLHAGFIRNKRRRKNHCAVYQVDLHNFEVPSEETVSRSCDKRLVKVIVYPTVKRALPSNSSVDFSHEIHNPYYCSLRDIREKLWLSTDEDDRVLEHELSYKKISDQTRCYLAGVLNQVLIKNIRNAPHLSRERKIKILKWIDNQKVGTKVYIIDEEYGQKEHHGG